MTIKEMTLSGPSENVWSRTLDSLNRSWYKFSRNWLSILGLGMVLTIVLLAVFAPYVAPYPQHAGT
jgi:peptide/nickel transport system permease protein